MRGIFILVACSCLACGNAPAPARASAPSAVATATTTATTTASAMSAIASADAGVRTNASPPDSADPIALCRLQPSTCKTRLVDAQPFCGPTALWQMHEAGFSPGDPRATRPVKECTCDRCASDVDCNEKSGGHCRELDAAGTCGLPEKWCVYPKGPCAACPNACLHTGDSLTCAHNAPPP